MLNQPAMFVPGLPLGIVVLGTRPYALMPMSRPKLLGYAVLFGHTLHAELAGVDVFKLTVPSRCRVLSSIVVHDALDSTQLEGEIALPTQSKTNWKHLAFGSPKQHVDRGCLSPFAI